MSLFNDIIVNCKTNNNDEKIISKYLFTGIKYKDLLQVSPTCDYGMCDFCYKIKSTRIITNKKNKKEYNNVCLHDECLTKCYNVFVFQK